jgi:two-component system cell cycle sensor histidine kinase/response regulator CckA
MQIVLEDSLIVLDTIPDAYLRCDPAFQLTFANRAAEELLETRRTDLIGRTLQEVLPQDLRTPLDTCLRSAMAERAVAGVDCCCARRGGWYTITAMPDSAGGLVIRFCGITGLHEHPASELASWLERIARESEEKFSKAFQSNPAAMSIVNLDKDSIFVDVNQAFERITGYSREEAIGRTPVELGLYADASFQDESRRRLRAGGYHNLEFPFRTKNGSVVIGRVSAEPIRIDGDLCAISVAVDVTEQRRTEQALKESEELYRHLFEVESDALLLVDRESRRILAANMAATQLYGYTREELLSMEVTGLSAEPEKTTQALAKMQHFIPLRWHRKKDGAVFPLEIKSCYFDLKGRSVIFSAIRDITERKQMEDALRESKEKLSKAFQSNPAAVLILDLTTHTYVEVNEAFEEITGYQRDEVIGKPWMLAVDPADRDDAVRQFLREGRVRNREYHFRKRDGALATGLVSAEPIEVDGKPHAIASLVDITARLKLESQLRQSQKLESVGRLAGGVAHDFNNLLTVISGYSGFVLKALRPQDPLYPHVQEIKKAAERAASLTKQLLTFSRKQVIEPKPLDVNAIVNDAERMLERLIGEDIELSTALDPMAGLVMADPDQVHQVIMNLVVNARDAMPDGGKLEIATKNVDLDECAAAIHPEAAPGRYVRVSVTDTGIGMDEATLQSVFEPFFTTKEIGKGTGLGLATVYGIVRQGGGWIHVCSEVGQGTSFRVYLPRVDACVLPEQPGLPVPSTVPHGETVLLVEDEDDVRKLTRAILDSYGYHVLAAADGSEALTFARDHPGEIHLLLTDVILRGMNGKDLSERVRILRPNIKILFTSGHSADIISRRGVLEQDVAYLPKPFSPDSLAAKLRDVLS